MKTKSDKIRALIAAQKGKFFSISFIKRTNGEKRHLVGRKNVKKYLVGGPLAYSPKDHNLEIVWEVATKCYKAIPLESVYLFNGKKVSGNPKMEGLGKPDYKMFPKLAKEEKI